MSQKILVVNSSPRNDSSLTRGLVEKLIAGLQTQAPDSTVTLRDLAAAPFPHLDEKVLAGFFTPAAQRTADVQEALALSDQAVAEVLAADILVIGAPMWNFGVPSVLKAWIDHIARAGLTFRYTASGPEGLATGKRAIIVSARGGIYSQGPLQSLDHQESHLTAVLNFIGITDIEIVRVEGAALGPDSVKQGLAVAEQKLAGLLAKAA